MPLIGIGVLVLVASLVTPESERMVTAFLQLVTIWLLQRHSREIREPMSQISSLVRRKLGDRTPSIAEQDQRARQAGSWDGNERRKPPPSLGGGR